MKTTSKTYFLLGVLCIFLISCKGKQVEPISGVMNARIDGNYWQSTSAIANITNGTIKIYGTDSLSGQSIKLALSGDDEATYDLSLGSGNAAIYKPNYSDSTYLSHVDGGHGRVEVTDINKSAQLISGTFYLKGVQTVTGEKIKIKGGSFFDIPYITNVTETIEDENSLTAKINGSNYFPTTIFATILDEKITIVSKTSTDYPGINMTLIKNAGFGWYLPSTADGNTVTYHKNDTTEINMSSGEIFVNLHNQETRHIEGTFSVSGDGASISNGLFNIDY